MGGPARCGLVEWSESPFPESTLSVGALSAPSIDPKIADFVQTWSPNCDRCDGVAAPNSGGCMLLS